MIVSPCSVTAASLLRKLMLLFLHGACGENWTDIFSGAYNPETFLSSLGPGEIKWFRAFSSVPAPCIQGSSPMRLMI